VVLLSPAFALKCAASRCKCRNRTTSSFNDPLDTKPALSAAVDAEVLEGVLTKLFEQRVSAEMSAAAAREISPARRSAESKSRVERIGRAVGGKIDVFASGSGAPGYRFQNVGFKPEARRNFLTV
jgi:hypothetical protein